jgi:hypothetical protein
MDIADTSSTFSVLRRHWIALAALLAGLALMVWAGKTIFWDRHKALPVEFRGSLLYFWHGDSDMATNLERRVVRTEVRGQLIVPETIRIHDSFVAELLLTGDEDFNLYFSDIEYQLSAAGLDIRPESQWLKPTLEPSKDLQKTGVIRWSLKVDSVGQFVMVINARYTDESNQIVKSLKDSAQTVAKDARLSGNRERIKEAQEMMARYESYRPELRVLGISPIKLRVQPTVKYYAEKGLPFVGGLLGSLLTLPGILAFKESRDRKRKELLRLQIATELPNSNRRS